MAVSGSPAAQPRRRRPVGEPPPLPRDWRGFLPLWIGVVILLGLVYWWGRSTGAAGSFQRSLDHALNRHFPNLQQDWRRGLPSSLKHGAGWWVLVAARWIIATLLVAWKRWRHLAVFAGSAALVAVVTGWFPTAGRVGTGVPGHPSSAAASL